VVAAGLALTATVLLSACQLPFSSKRPSWADFMLAGISPAVPAVVESSFIERTD
jgi:hypothetical protein